MRAETPPKPRASSECATETSRGAVFFKRAEGIASREPLEYPCRMKFLLCLLALAAPVFALADDLSFTEYHSQDAIKAYLQKAAHDQPDLVRFRKRGQSRQGREIDLAIVSRGDPLKKPAIYFNGTHHGDEWTAT